MNRKNLKTLIFSYSEKHVSMMVHLQKKVKGTVVIVALNENVAIKLQEKGIPYIKSRDFLTVNEYEKITKDALSWLQTWPSKRTNGKVLRKYWHTKTLLCGGLQDQHFYMRTIEL